MTYRPITAIAALLLVGACASPDTITREKIVHVNVPVVQPCVGSPRPAEVAPLKSEMTPPEWHALDVRQKSARAGLKAFEHKAYGENLAAVTGACP